MCTNPNPVNNREIADQVQGWTGIAFPAYLLLGICFGVTLTRSEVLSWFRIQEMFRFQYPRMYEIIGSAVVVAAASAALGQEARVEDRLG